MAFQSTLEKKLKKKKEEEEAKSSSTKSSSAKSSSAKSSSAKSSKQKELGDLNYVSNGAQSFRNYTKTGESKYKTNKKNYQSATDRAKNASTAQLAALGNSYSNLGSAASGLSDIGKAAYKGIKSLNKSNQSAVEGSKYTSIINPSSKSSVSAAERLSENNNLSTDELKDKISNLEYNRAKLSTELKKLSSGTVSNRVSNSLSAQELEQQIKQVDSEITSANAALKQSANRDALVAKKQAQQEHLENLDSLANSLDDTTKEQVLKYYDQYQEMQMGKTDTGYEAGSVLLQKKLGISATEVNQLGQYLQTQVDDAAAAEAQQKTVEYATEHPILSSITSVADNLYGGISAGLEMGRYAIYGDKDQSLNTSGYGFANTNKASTTRETVSNNIENPVGKFLYNVGMSMADSSVAMTLGGGISALGYESLGQNVTLGLMGAAAGAQGAKSADDNGVTGKQAVLTAALQGGAEALFESIPLENIYKIAKGGTSSNAVKELLKQANIEGLEEVGTDIANLITDSIVNADKSELAQNAANYEKAGYGSNDAYALAVKDFLEDTLVDYAAGAISGGVMGGGAYGANYINNRTVGANIANTEDAETYVAKATTIDNQDVQNIVEKYKNNASNATLGRIKSIVDSYENQYGVIEDYTTSLENNIAENSTIDNNVIKNTVTDNNAAENNTINTTDDLETYALTDDDIELAEGILKTGDIKSAREAYNLLTNAKNISSETKSDYKDTFELRIAEADANGLKKEADEAINSPTAKEAKEYALSGEELTDDVLKTWTLDAQIAYTEGRMSYIEDSQKATNTAKIGAEDVTLKSVKSVGDNATVEIENGASTETVDLSKLNLSKSTQKLYDYATSTDSTELANLIVDNYVPTVGTEYYINQIDNAYQTGLRGGSFDTVYTETVAKFMSRSTLEKIYDAGVKQKNAEHKEETYNGNKSNNPGKVTASEGTSKELKTIYKLFANKLGIEIEEADLDGLYRGTFKESEGKITINANMVEDKRFIALVHETGEWLKTWNTKGMEDVAQAITDFASFKNGSSNVNREIDRYKEVYAQVEGSKTFADAAEEYAFDNLFAVLLADDGGAEFFNYLNDNYTAEESKSILEKIADFIKDLIDRLENFVYGSEDFEGEIKTLKEIRQNVMSAINEGVKAQNASKATEGGEIRNSLNVFGLESYTDKEIKNLTFNNTNTQFANTKEDIVSFVNNNVHKKPYTRILVGKIGNELGNRILKDTGINITNYNIAITSEFENSHSDAKKESYQGMIAITPNEVAMLPYIIGEYDSVTYGGKNKEKQDVLRFEKNIDGKKIAVEYISNRRKTINLQTMYGWENKKSSAKELDAKAPNRTPETNFGTSFSDLNVTQSDKNSKRNSLDVEYLNAVEEGNEEKMQTLVQQAARAAGYDSPKLYHGTQEFGFTQLDTSMSDDGFTFFATNNPSIASSYSGVAGERGITESRTITDENIADMVKETGLFKNVYDFPVGDIEKRYDYLNKTYNSLTSFAQKNKDTMQKKGLWEDYLKLSNALFDGIVFKNISEREVGNNIRKLLRPLKNAHYVISDYANTLDNALLLVKREGIENHALILDNMIKTAEQVKDNYLPGETWGNYGLYANTDNMLEVDGKGANWNTISGENGEKLATREIAERAKNQGYDGVIIRNITDDGGKNRNKYHYNEHGDIYIFFNPQQQCKSADPITYDDKGDIIPLSERFNNANSDIRYSLDVDSDGNKLTERQKEYFKNSKILDKNGNLKVMYHGTTRSGFTTFDVKERAGYFFTDNKEIAGAVYAKLFATDSDKYNVNPDYPLSYEELSNAYDSLTDGYLEKQSDGSYLYDDENIRFATLKEAQNYLVDNFTSYNAAEDEIAPSIYSVYINAENPYIVECNGKYWNNLTLNGESATTDDITEWAKEKGYDSVIFNNLVDGGNIAAQVVTVFEANQIKSIYNENPTDDADIRFSLDVPVEEAKNLIAIHNLSTDEMLKTLELGGFPMPSIAITKADMGHDMYGNVSVLFNKETIDPQFIKKNKVYSGDAYTPEFPSVEYMINGKAIKNVQKIVKELTGDLYGLFGNVGLDTDNAEDKLNRNQGNVVDAYGSDDTLEYAFTQSKGEKIDVPMREKKISYNYDNDEIEYIALMFTPEEAIKHFQGSYADYEMLLKDGTIDKIIEKLNALEKKKYSKSEKLYEKLHTTELSFNEFNTLMNAIVNYNRDGFEKVVDKLALGNTVHQYVMDNYEEYKEWLNDLFDGVIEKAGIRNQKDMFLPSGNRRSFEGLHYEYNLANLVKAMKEEPETGSGFGGYSFFGSVNREFDSIEDIHSEEDRLQLADEEEYNNLKKEIEDDLKAVAMHIKTSSSWDVYETMSDIAEAVAKRKTASGVKKFLSEWYNVTDEDVAEIMELKERAAALPTGYFEAKPQRAVYLNEIARVIVPDLEKNLIDALNERNIPYDTYKAGDKEDRKNVVNSVDSVRFSLDIPDIADYSYSDIAALAEDPKAILKDAAHALHNRVVDENAVLDICRKLKKEYQADYSAPKLKSNVVKVLEYMQTSKTLNYNELLSTMQDVVKPLIETINNVNPIELAEYENKMAILKTYNFKPSETQKAEIINAFGSYKAFRDKYRSTIKMSDKGTAMDGVWNELADQLNLPYDVSDADMPLVLAQLVDEKPTSIDIGMSEDELSLAAAIEIFKKYFESQSEAIKDKETLAKVKKAAKDMGVSAAEYTDYIKNKEKLKYTEKAANNRKRKQMYEIRKIANRISTYIKKPTDKKHIPENLKRPVLAFMSTLDMTIRDPESKAALAWQSNLNTFANILDELRKNNPDSEDYIDLTHMDDALVDTLRDIATKYTNSDSLIPISRLSAEDTFEFLKCMRALSAAINHYNENFSNDRYSTVAEVGRETLNELRENKKNKPNGWFKKILVKEMDAFTWAESLGKGAESEIAALREGFNVRAKHLKETQEYMTELKKGVKTKGWFGDNAKTYTFNLEDGDITLTIGQIMDLFLLNRREQARKHIYKEGLTAQTGKNIQSLAVKVTPEEVAEITSVLTDEQRKYAEGMQAFVNDVSSEWGNHTSMAMWGYRKFTERNYWPIKVDTTTTQTTDSNKQSGNASFYSIKNMSSSKAVEDKASNAVELGDAAAKFAKHIEDMANYDGYVMPLTDIMRWYNFKETAWINDSKNIKKPYTETVKRSIRNTLGKEGTQYFENLIEDINGAQRGRSTPGIDKFTGFYKAAAVGGNLRVVVQQPTAYFRAMMYLSPRDLATGMFSFKNASEAKEHSMIAWWKSQGYYETYMGKSIEQIVTGESSLGETIRDKSSVAAALADELTWGHLWGAVKNEQYRLNPNLDVNSEEFLEKVAKRFDEVIDRTQVVDSVLHRSELLRSNDGLTKMTMSFLSEPTKSLNMIQSAVRSGNKGRVTKAVQVYVITNLLAAAAAGLVDVLRDDDEDETLLDKWLQTMIGQELYNAIKAGEDITWDAIKSAIGSNVGDQLNPFAAIPIIKEIFSILQGYDATRMDLASLTTAFNAASKVIKYIQQDGTETTHITEYGVVNETSKAISQLTGIPVYNILRDVYGIYNKVSGKTLEKSYTNSPYRDLDKAIEEGGDLSIVKDLMETKETSAITSHLTSTYKETYLELLETDKTAAAKLKSQLITLYMTTHKDSKKSNGDKYTSKELRENANKWIANWSN